MFLLDTNTLIYFFKGMGRVSERLLSVPPNRVCVSAVSVFAIEVGLSKSASRRRRAQLDHFLAAVRTIPFGPSEARVAAEIRALLESRGTPLGPFDTLIAGTARVANATLVTHDTNEFERVPKLKMDDWY